jgi:hypothetical protein
MRKQNKYIVRGALTGFGISALIDLIFQCIDLVDNDEKITLQKLDFGKSLTTSLYGAAIGAGVGYIIYNDEVNRESNLPFCPDEYLQAVLKHEDLRANPELVNAAISFRDKLKYWIVGEFGYKLVTQPVNSGSFTKRTANVSNFDVDILLPFKKESFNSLEEMYSWTFSKLHQRFKAIANVYKNGKAITIKFTTSEENSISFDILPGREIGNYKVDKKLNLFLESISLWKKNSSFKIDSSIQRNITINKPEARKTIRLLKIYNNQNRLNIPKLLLEQGVVETLSSDQLGVYSSPTDNLLNSMNFISEILNQDYYFDWANSNNNLSNKMTKIERISASKFLDHDIKKIEAKPSYLTEIFEH